MSPSDVTVAVGVAVRRRWSRSRCVAVGERLGGRGVLRFGAGRRGVGGACVGVCGVGVGVGGAGKFCVEAVVVLGCHPLIF